MIDEIVNAPIQRSGSGTTDHTIPIGGRRTVTAHIALAKIDGDSQAKAYIFSYDTQTAPDVINSHIVGEDPNTAPAAIHDDNVVAVQFRLKTVDEFAEAICTVFIHT